MPQHSAVGDHGTTGERDGSGALVARTDLRRVDVTGADRLRYLEDVTSQSFADVKPGDVRGALYLDAHGAPLAMFDVAVLADRVLLLAPDDAVATTLVEVLGGRTFLLDATFSATEDVVVVLRGAEAEPISRAAGVPTPPPDTVRPAGDAVLIGRAYGMDVVGPPAAIEDVVGWLVAGGASEGGTDELEAWRVAAGVPAWGRDVVAPHLPEEAGLLPTHVHLGKGCYPGQEAVARMWMLGRPRRRLAVLAPVGTQLHRGWETGEGRRKVTITSVSPAGDLALGFVPSDAGAGDVLADDDGVGVQVRSLVGGDALPPGHDPAVIRRRDRPRA